MPVRAFLERVLSVVHPVFFFHFLHKLLDFAFYQIEMMAQILPQLVRGHIFGKHLAFYDRVRVVKLLHFQITGNQIRVQLSVERDFQLKKIVQRHQKPNGFRIAFPFHGQLDKIVFHPDFFHIERMAVVVDGLLVYRQDLPSEYLF